ncbi:MAG TPA: Ppx/GppA phosphatase family protein [Micropepsaceae bacterium]|nr:Ppx/GppA phosphatase family protein [Micropepsaceae bacterium]
MAIMNDLSRVSSSGLREADLRAKLRENGEEAVLAAVRAGKKRHPYHRRRRGGQEAHAHSNGAPVLGAIDVGTNACRLLIAVPEKSYAGAVPRVIDSYTANVCLGESLERTGTITEAALDRTVAALKVCAARLKRRHVTHVKAIATEACRRAINAQELVRRAEAEAGIRLTIVTPEEEARLAAAGCLQLIGSDFEGALIFDIGGGSTELILVRREAARVPMRYDIVAWSSAPIGVVKLAERYGGRELAASSYRAMRVELDAIFSAMKAELGPDIFDAKRYHLLGTSGTLTTLAGIKLGLRRYERSRIDGQWLKRADIVKISADIVTRDFAGRAAIPCIGTDRADLILPGCAILDAIMDNWPSATLRVADRGLREGMLIALLRDSEGPQPEHAI